MTKPPHSTPTSTKPHSFVVYKYELHKITNSGKLPLSAITVVKEVQCGGFWIFTCLCVSSNTDFVYYHRNALCKQVSVMLHYELFVET